MECHVTIRRQKLSRETLSRRAVLAGAAGLAAGIGAARDAAAQAIHPGEYRELLKKLAGSRTVTPGKVKLHLPPIAENGNSVPLTVSIDNPMTPTNYVKVVHIVTENNPRPEVASFHFTPANGRAEVSTRIRLATTQHVFAYAELSDGSVWSDEAEAKVTIGGCGG